MSYKISAQCMTDKRIEKIRAGYFFIADQAEKCHIRIYIARCKVPVAFCRLSETLQSETETETETCLTASPSYDGTSRGATLTVLPGEVTALARPSPLRRGPWHA